MTPASDVPGIDDDETFRRREHVVERAGWWIMLAVVVAAVLGLFGHGLLSHRSVEGSDGRITIEYERTARRGGPTDVDVTLRPAEGADRVAFMVSRSYLAHVDVESITPEPVEMSGVGDGVRFEFANVTGAEFTVRMQVRPDALGAIEAEMQMAGGSTITFDQFVLP